MLVRKEKLKRFLETKNLSKEKFAAILDVETTEAEVAQHYIDWKAMNIENPLEDKK